MNGASASVRRAGRGEEIAAAAATAGTLRIGYLPCAPMTNKYAESFIDILGAFGGVSALPQPRHLLRRPWRLRREFDVAVVNWIELDLVRRADGAFSPAGFLKVLARVLVYRCLARRLVYVRHNNFPHGTRAADERVAQRALDLIEGFFDVVLTHSGHALAGRRHYVPHPLYRPATDALDESEAALLARLPADCHVVFGRIEAYKRIERLLAVFPPTHRLLVFGAVEDPAYVDELQRQAGENVTLLAGYVSEALAQALVRRARGLVLCHAERDMIVSGSLFYALSLGTPVFALATPGLAWIRQRLDGALIHLAPDLPALAAMIAAAPAGAPDEAQWRPRVEAEFGDARIRATLAELLFQ